MLFPAGYVTYFREHWEQAKFCFVPSYPQIVGPWKSHTLNAYQGTDRQNRGEGSTWNFRDGRWARESRVIPRKEVKENVKYNCFLYCQLLQTNISLIQINSKFQHIFMGDWPSSWESEGLTFSVHMKLHHHVEEECTRLRTGLWQISDTNLQFSRHLCLCNWTRF